MKLKSIEELSDRKRNAIRMLESMLQGPAGKDLIHYLESELGIEQIVGKDTHDTYYNLGKMEAIKLIKQLGGIHD